MKLEMDGREPLFLFFGLPAASTLLMLASIVTVWCLTPHTPAVHLDVKPTLKADFTGAALPVTVNARPAEVVLKECPVPAPYEVRVAPSPPPDVRVMLPRDLTLNVTGMTPVPVKVEGRPQANEGPRIELINLERQPAQVPQPAESVDSGALPPPKEKH